MMSQRRPQKNLLIKILERSQNQIGNCIQRTFKIEDVDKNEHTIEHDTMKTCQFLGRGAYGHVEKVIHPPTGLFFALKRVIFSNTDDKYKLTEIKILETTNGCSNVTRFYGALFWENELQILTELMDCSLLQFYCKIFVPANIDYNKDATNKGYPQLELNSHEHEYIPQYALQLIAKQMVKGLDQLHELRIIHRDIKPNNILINKNGDIKLCDFGISGILSDQSNVTTFDAGCRPYMAPEKINRQERQEYGPETDVWSFGLTMLEISIGKYPYANRPNLGYTEAMHLIVQNDAPSLPKNSHFSKEYQDFIGKCLIKNAEERPKRPRQLLQDDFFKQPEYKEQYEQFVREVLS